MASREPDLERKARIAETLLAAARELAEGLEPWKVPCPRLPNVLLPRLRQGRRDCIVNPQERSKLAREAHLGNHALE